MEAPVLGQMYIGPLGFQRDSPAVVRAARERFLAEHGRLLADLDTPEPAAEVEAGAPSDERSKPAGEVE